MAAARTALSLELFDFALPDENTMHAMVYYASDQPELYHGRNMDAAYHRFAHRQRIELVHAYDIATARAALGRFTGRGLHARRTLRGPGPGCRQHHRPRLLLWSRHRLRRPRERVGTCGRVDDISDAIAAEGADVPLHAGRAAATPVPAHPAAGRERPLESRARAARCRSSSPSEYVDALAPAIDIWCSGPQGFQIERARQERARGHDYWFYNGGRPAGGAITIDAPATDSRATIWAGIKHDARVYFYWHAVHWRHNSQKRGERNQNVWAESITFDNRGQPNKPIDDQGYIHGDGVLLYPGEDVLHPDQDRGIRGPISTVQLANIRRGLQDQQYIALARQPWAHGGGGRGSARDRAARVLGRRRHGQFP